MTNLVTHAHRVCGLLLRLYPTAFRKEFAAEIQDVIGAKLSDASQASTLSVTVVCLQELLDLAVNLLNEYQNQLFQTKGDPHLMSSPG